MFSGLKELFYKCSLIVLWGDPNLGKTVLVSRNRLESRGDLTHRQYGALLDDQRAFYSNDDIVLLAMRYQRYRLTKDDAIVNMSQGTDLFWSHETILVT